MSKVISITNPSSESHGDTDSYKFFSGCSTALCLPSQQRGDVSGTLHSLSYHNSSRPMGQRANVGIVLVNIQLSSVALVIIHSGNREETIRMAFGPTGHTVI